MSYQVLARKYRPHHFNDMVGQEHILRMLSNALEQNRLHHAYLLTGTRGVGKTTLARIMAKCLNCETGVTPTPCDQCHACKAIDAGQFLDLYEIDAASRTKVEDTRELLDNVPYAPTQGRYKVYLIDEVHMLSNHSFNALLKTLEEPPEHVKFILATTDPKRLPITILSRCLQFHLKRITPAQIAKHLAHICGLESIKHDETALNKLAQAADGSMRDALSLLDQAIAYGHGAVTQQDVHAMLGSLSQDDLIPLLDALYTQDGKRLMSALQQLAEHSPDFHQVLEEFTHIFHSLAMAQVIPGGSDLKENLAPYVTRFTPEDVQLYYQIALLGRRDLSLTPSPQQGFEMTLLRMLAFKPQQTPPSTAAPVTSQAAPTPTAAAKPAQPAAPAVSTSAITGSSDWQSILPALKLTGMAEAFASHCVLTNLTDTKVSLTVSQSHAAMLNPKLKERLSESLSRHFNRPLQVDVTVTTDELTTPAKQKQSEQKQQVDQATQNILMDPQVKKLIEMYDATLDVSLITKGANNVKNTE